jgi:zinc finger CCHC domain-containing protein 9
MNLLCIDHLAGKAQRSEQRRVGRQAAKHASTTCFACRSKGHAAKDCPNVLLASASSDLAPVGEESAGDKRKAEESQQAPPRGMKRAKGKKGADVAGTSGRCYRCVLKQNEPIKVGLTC